MNQSIVRPGSEPDKQIMPIIKQALAELYETNEDVADLHREQVSAVLTQVANQVKELSQCTAPVLSNKEAQVWYYEPNEVHILFAPGAWRRAA